MCSLCGGIFIYLFFEMTTFGSKQSRCMSSHYTENYIFYPTYMSGTLYRSSHYTSTHYLLDFFFSIKLIACLLNPAYVRDGSRSSCSGHYELNYNQISLFVSLFFDGIILIQEKNSHRIGWLGFHQIP